MSVVADDIAGTGSDRTIHKFVVIRVCRNHLKMEIGNYHLHIITINEVLDDIFSNHCRGFSCNDFLIFHQNFI